jgi:hypothetical protein
MKTSSVKIPKNTHFAVLYYVRGRKKDPRSKYLVYQYFADEHEFKKWFNKNDHKKFQVIIADPVKRKKNTVNITYGEENPEE